jgi:hypothetical protein
MTLRFCVESFALEGVDVPCSQEPQLQVALERNCAVIYDAWGVRIIAAGGYRSCRRI